MSLFLPSPRFDEYPVNDLVLACHLCGRFYARCPRHASWTCHRNRVVYTDGACSHNGRFDAQAGIGVAFGNCTEDEGDNETHQFSLPVDYMLDPDGPRSNQRAELLAALVGLQKICDVEETEWSSCPRKDHPHRNAPSRDWIIIATDSKYVVSGMTELLPKWRENGFLSSKGRQPVNLDLFLKIEAEIEEQEDRLGYEIKFWHIGREYNGIADGLARHGVNA